MMAKVGVLRSESLKNDYYDDSAFSISIMFILNQQTRKGIRFKLNPGAYFNDSNKKQLDLFIVHPPIKRERETSG